tara:strand:+ start:2339 stop:3040 length:702 start_codon:yes stop_codon:yes gene_type:complete
MAKSKSRSKRKSKRTSKPRTSHKGLIAGLSITGVVALIAGALVVMYLMGVFDDLFKKKSKPRVNDKRGPSSSNKDLSTMNLVNIPGFIDGQTDKTQSGLLGSVRKRSILDTFDKTNGPLPSQFEYNKPNVQTYSYENKQLYFISPEGSGDKRYPVSFEKNPEYFEIEVNQSNLDVIYKFKFNELTVTVKDTEQPQSEANIYSTKAKYEYYPDANVVVVSQPSGFIVLPEELFR